MNLRDAMAELATIKPLPKGKVETWLNSLDEADLPLARELLYSRNPDTPSGYEYSSPIVSDTLAKVGVRIGPTTIRAHRRSMEGGSA